MAKYFIITYTTIRSWLLKLDSADYLNSLKNPEQIQTRDSGSGR